MRRRHLWLLFVVGLGVLLGYWWNRRAARIASPAPPPATTQAVPKVGAPKPDVPIQDLKTIDFSSGKPVVKDSADDKAVIDRAKKEMDDATKDITFEPTPPPKK